LTNNPHAVITVSIEDTSPETVRRSHRVTVRLNGDEQAMAIFRDSDIPSETCEQSEFIGKAVAQLVRLSLASIEVPF